MTHVITALCVDCLDTGCVDVCPVECIAGPVPTGEIRAAGSPPAGVQLYIDPDECIGCGACVPECPADAIFADDDLPEAHRAAAEENAAFFRGINGAGRGGP